MKATCTTTVYQEEGTNATGLPVPVSRPCRPVALSKSAASSGETFGKQREVIIKFRL
jgi:hypothetical protein